MLGTMLLSREAISAASTACGPDDFYRPAHGHIFEAILALDAKEHAADPVSVADQLSRAGLLDAVGGPAALVTLQANAPATSSAATHASIVARTSLLRSLLGRVAEISQAAYADNLGEARGLLAEANRTVNPPADEVQARPVLDEVALHGPIGAFVRDADPHTEADAAGVLVSILAAAGTMIGLRPHIVLGNDRHRAQIWAVLVGRTAGGKGTAWSAARALLALVDPEFFGTGTNGRVMGGFNSGEAVIEALADEDGTDKRLLVLETEFGRLLKSATREGNTVGAVLRNGWDASRLEARATKAGAGVRTASGYLLGLLGHVTVEELRARLGETEHYGGTAGRHLWVVVGRSKRLPAGGNIPAEILRRHASRLSVAVGGAREIDEVIQTDAARGRWVEIYGHLCDDEPAGLLGAAIARGRPYTLRLALAYALLDGSPVIDIEHLEAAWALWRYCRASAAWIWGQTLGDPIADRLLAELRRIAPDGLDLTAQSGLFGRNVDRKELEAARAHLHKRGLATTSSRRPDGGRGRTVHITYAVTKERKYEISPESEKRVLSVISSHTPEGS